MSELGGNKTTFRFQDWIFVLEIYPFVPNVLRMYNAFQMHTASDRISFQWGCVCSKRGLGSVCSQGVSALWEVSALGGSALGRGLSGGFYPSWTEEA